MSHSPAQLRKKHEARAESLHHHHSSAVDGPHDDMKTNEHMYKPMAGSKTDAYENDMEKGD